MTFLSSFNILFDFLRTSSYFLLISFSLLIVDVLRIIEEDMTRFTFATVVIFLVVRVNYDLFIWFRLGINFYASFDILRTTEEDLFRHLLYFEDSAFFIFGFENVGVGLKRAFASF